MEPLRTNEETWSDLATQRRSAQELALVVRRRLLTLLGRAHAARPRPIERLVVRDGKNRHVVSLERLLYVRADRNHTLWTTASDVHRQRSPLNLHVPRLVRAGLIRLGRSLAVHPMALGEIRFRRGGGAILVFVTGHRLEVSRLVAQRLVETLDAKRPTDRAEVGGRPLQPPGRTSTTPVATGAPSRSPNQATSSSTRSIVIR